MSQHFEDIKKNRDQCKSSRGWFLGEGWVDGWVGGGGKGGVRREVTTNVTSL